MPTNSISYDEIKAAMDDPSVKDADPANKLQNLSNLLGIGDVEAVDSEEAQRIRDTYFQAFVLSKDTWAPMGPGTFIQVAPFKLKDIPSNTRLVADVLIDKSEFEAECYDRYIKNIGVSGKTLVFSATVGLPVDITIGMKCVDIYDNPVKIDDSLFWPNV